MVNNLITVALGTSLLGITTFAILYTWKANWRKNPSGRQMFFFGWSFALTLSTNLLRVVYKGPVIDTIRVTSLFVLAVVIWAQVYVLAKSLWGKRAKG